MYLRSTNYTHPTCNTKNNTNLMTMVKKYEDHLSRRRKIQVSLCFSIHMLKQCILFIIFGEFMPVHL
jgi:hypothetical protein